MSGRERRRGDVRYGDGYITERKRKDGSTVYQARWHDGNGWRAKSFNGSIHLAEDFLRSRQRDIRTGRYVADEDVTVLQAIDDYLKRGASRWRGSTRASYGEVRDRVSEHTLSRVRLSDLTPRQCQHWIDDMVKVYSANRMIVMRAVVNGALRESMRLGVIHSNPMSGVRMPSPRKREYDVWSPEDAAKAIDLSRDDHLLHTYYVVALTTGMRPGEIRGLQWGDIDLSRGRMTISRTQTRNEFHSPIVGTTTKGGRARKIVIPSTTVDVLKAHKARQNERRLSANRWYNGDMVFDRGNGEPLPQQTIMRRHKEFTDAHGLPACRLHDLRHTAASLLFQAGTPIKVISDMLGHASVTITMDIYAHTDEAMQREAASTLEALVTKRRVGDG